MFLKGDGYLFRILIFGATYLDTTSQTSKNSVLYKNKRNKKQEQPAQGGMKSSQELQIREGRGARPAPRWAGRVAVGAKLTGKLSGCSRSSISKMLGFDKQQAKKASWESEG